MRQGVMLSLGVVLAVVGGLAVAQASETGVGAEKDITEG